MVGGTLYVTFSDIYLVKKENEAVAPLNLNFIKHMLIIYLTDVRKKILFSKVLLSTIKTLRLPWKSV